MATPPRKKPCSIAHLAEFDFWFFQATPYAEYKNFVNASSLFVASTESGADHPPYDAGCTGQLTCCADPDALIDPLAGTYVDTAFDARFCAFNIHRLLVVNEVGHLCRRIGRARLGHHHGRRERPGRMVVQVVPLRSSLSTTMRWRSFSTNTVIPSPAWVTSTMCTPPGIPHAVTSADRPASRT